MTEWQIVLVLVTLIGLVVTIVTPIIKLNTNIVRLTDSVDRLRDEHRQYALDNDTAHEQLHERINHRENENKALSKRVDDHEHRITALEHN